MHAKIGAPPGKFYVDTPAATAVDLGCEYRLEVDEGGSGSLSVLLGYVGFEYKGRESYVPERARCLMRPEVGPGTPFYADASAAFQAALERFDFSQERAALPVLLSEARPRDALTLWHLLLVEGLTLAGARRKLEEDSTPVAADVPVIDELIGRHGDGACGSPTSGN